MNFSLRVTAVACIFAWLFASLACSLEAFGGDSHGDAAHHAGADHDSAVAHTHAAADHSHDSGGSEQHGDDSCCSSLKSVQPGGQSSIILKPSFTVAWLHALYSVEAPVLPTPTATIFRQRSARDRVFTPEVCLGPAFRSLAPPVSS